MKNVSLDKKVKSKIKKGDQVIVRSGSFKGRIGAVERVFADGRLHISGVACKKHVRPNPQKNIEGGIVDKPVALLGCKVSIYNPVTKKADSIGYKFLEDGRKVRCFKSNNEIIDL